MNRSGFVHHIVSLTVIWLALAAHSGVLRAQDYGARVHVLHPLAATSSFDATAAATEIETRSRDAAAEGLADVLLEVPGARPYRTGSLGSSTTAALRGADAEHTAVLFGEIPLTSADAATFDLSALPLALADRVVVYRGGAPLALSQGSIGGVIQLLPREAADTRTSLSASAGSFGTYGLTTDSSVARGTLKVQALSAVLGSSGDFPVSFDNKTSFDPRDDFVLRRPNADFVQGNAFVSASEKLGAGTLSGLLLGYARTGGEPGPPANPVYKARRQQLQGLAELQYAFERRADNGRPAVRVAALGSVSAGRNRFNDPLDEVGTSGGTLVERNQARGFGRLAAEAQLFDGAQLSALGTLSRDENAADDRFTRVPMPDSSRTTLAGGAELLLHGSVVGHRVELRPSVRVEHSSARLHTERFGDVVQTDRTTTLGTYRVAAALELLRELSLSAAFSSGARLASMLELFGDGALLLGNTALRPEHSRSWDVGLSSVLARGSLNGSFELRAFDLQIRDQVLFVRNAFSQLLPLNLAHAQVRGLEAGARAVIDRFWLNGALTLLDTEGKPGKRLPNRPRATLLLQPGVEFKRVGPLDRVRGFVELQYIASSFDDPDNQSLPKPPALFLDAGVSLQLLREHAWLRLSVSDVLDHGGRDLRQFPLPGRTIMVSVTYNEG